MKSFTLFSIVALALAIGCSSNNKVTKLKPGQKPPATSGNANPKATPVSPAPASAPIARNASNEILGNFSTKCGTGTYKVQTTPTIEHTYNSYVVLLDMDSTTITERVIWYKGSYCDIRNNTEPATASVEASKDVWYYKIDKQGAISTTPWEITYSEIGMDFTEDNSSSDQVHISYEYENETSKTALRFDSEEGEVYFRVQ